VETRGTGIRVLALCPGPTATGFLSGLGDERAASSSIYRRAANPARVVRAALCGFDQDQMTIIPGARNRLLPRATGSHRANKWRGSRGECSHRISSDPAFTALGLVATPNCSQTLLLGDGTQRYRSTSVCAQPEYRRLLAIWRIESVLHAVQC
jgi:hypothetical protein